MKNFLNSFFKLESHNTSIKTEIIAGFTTFITMVYIIIVNPDIMSDSGMDQDAIFVGTCLAAAIACILMGLFANWPIGLAPGMGLNIFFTYTVVGQMGYEWPVALGAVFIAGILFFLISITNLRRWMIDSIPFNLRIAIGAGVGLFIGFLGLQKGGIVINHDEVLVQLGDFASIETLLAALSFIIILVLGKRKIPGEIIIGILTTTLIAFLLGMVSYGGVFSKPPDISPTLMKLDILGALDVAMISVIMSFLFVNLFDTTGTLIGVASRANLLNDEGEAKNLDKALKADSSASIFGTFFGCSPVTSYVESSAGVEVGGRTGLTAVIVGVLFIFAIFLAPLSKMVPEYATAGALLYVCFLMLSGMQNLNWDDSKELIPALIIMVMIPLTYSIANGIALGFLVYIVLKISSGELYKISSGAWFLTIIFISNFIFLQN
ncbi:MAG: guanine permease [Gammaproteobacteria bacterium TMED234]|nr:MAG: guanine permease [Gammaproteobacteria bacterium TMED234]|tara:strand:- start:397 stop:1701 length:1305 start_codon:yes stop_codon:yes gene_type:complete